MIKIAICDDEKYMVVDIGIRIMDYFDDDKEKFELFEFSNGSDFLLFYNEEGKADIIFMDIEIGAENGVEIIAKIREIDENVIVIFVTSYTNYVNAAFRLSAFQYLVKPIIDADFTCDFSRALRGINDKYKILSINTVDGKKKIDISKIMYMCSEGKVVHIVMQNKTRYDVRSKLSDYKNNELISYFESSHKSYLINLRYVANIKTQYVVLQNNDIIPISRNCKMQFINKYNHYILKELI